MQAKMVLPRELPEFELNEDDQVWKQINDHHLYYIYDSIYYDGWKYAVYDVDGQEFLSKVRVVGIGRKGGVKRREPSLSEVASSLGVDESMLSDDDWIGGE